MARMPVPKIANNGSKSVLYSPIMDLFDERVLAVLIDGKPKFFAQLLGEAGFSRNTLKLHLKRLTAQSLVISEKTLSKRAKFLHPFLDFLFPLWIEENEPSQPR